MATGVQSGVAATRAARQHARPAAAARLARIVPAATLAGLTGAYVVLLAARFAQIIRWENADSDVASAFTLTEAIGHGHTGGVVLSTQGSWVPLLWGLLTRGLAFHRLVWELSPAALWLGAAGLVGWCVWRVAGRSAAGIALAAIVAASPVVLITATSAFFHNTTIPGAALLDAYLIWLTIRQRTTRALAASAVGMSVIVGALVASDELLAVVGLAPFLAASALAWVRRRDLRGLLPALAVTAGSIVAAHAISSIARSLHLLTTTPGVQLTLTMERAHLAWLGQGLLRMGNGLALVPEAGLRAVLTLMAAIVTVAALAGVAVVLRRAISLPLVDRHERLRHLHVVFWGLALVCAAIAYVVTDVAVEPSDRYIMIAVPAVAAIVPLLAGTRAGLAAVAAGACVFAAASLVALAAGDPGADVYRGADVAQLPAIERLVSALHLRVGYAGYWDAASLAWSSDGRLQVYPLIQTRGHSEPSPLARAGAWYRPRPATPSYLVLAPHDDDFPDHLPADLPAAPRTFALGQVTVDVYPYDIARLLHAAATGPSKRQGP